MDEVKSGRSTKYYNYLKKEHGFNDRSVCHRAKEEHNLGFRFLKHVYLYSLKRNSENTKYKKQN